MLNRMEEKKHEKTYTEKKSWVLLPYIQALFKHEIHISTE